MERRDFFISYTHKDEAWALWIADVLKSNGYTVYVQKLDIGPGDNFLDKMNEFLENSANFIVVWSKGYAQSRFCMTELQAAFYAYTKEQMNCLLPVRIDSYPMKPLYAALVHVDLSAMDAASEAKLIDAVRYAVSPIGTVLKNKSPENAETLVQRGIDYYYGRNGVKQDYDQAEKCFEQAALEDNGKGLCALGLSYLDSARYAESFLCFSQAANQGNEIGLFFMGLFYEGLVGDVKIDYEKALEYYQKSADKGYADAIERLAKLREKLYG